MSVALRVGWVVVLGGALLGLTAPASSAGTAPILVLESNVTCDTGTGDYDIIYSFTNPLTGSPAIVDVSTYRVDDVDVTAPTFAPDPIPTGDVASATDSVPGSTTSTFMSIVLDDAVDEEFAELTTDLDGTCAAAAPTTTTTTTAAVEVATTAQPAAAQTATPQFTG